MTIDPTSLSRLGPRSHTWTSTLRTAQSVMSEFDPKDKREWLGSMGLQDKRTTQKLTHDWSQPSRGQCGGKLGRDVGGQVGWSNTPPSPFTKLTISQGWNTGNFLFNGQPIFYDIKSLYFNFLNVQKFGEFRTFGSTGERSLADIITSIR
jgi:hypothetical protein